MQQTFASVQAIGLPDVPEIGRDRRSDPADREMGGTEMNKESLISMIPALFFVLFALVNAAAQTDIEGIRWELIEMHGKRIAASRIYIEFDDSAKRFSGQAACNRMFGSYELNNGRLKTVEIGTTKMVCLAPGVMETEAEFINALRHANKVLKIGQSLIFQDGNKQVLKFRKGRSFDREPPTMDLASRKWKLNKIRGIRVDIGKDLPFLNFDAEKGSAGGNSGCNVFGGNYEALGTSISFSDIISTMRACEFEGRMGIERGFLDGLRNADRFEIRNDRLYLYVKNELVLEFDGAAK